jgi:hypothetical protein
MKAWFLSHMNCNLWEILPFRPTKSMNIPTFTAFLWFFFHCGGQKRGISSHKKHKLGVKMQLDGNSPVMLKNKMKFMDFSAAGRNQLFAAFKPGTGRNS